MRIIALVSTVSLSAGAAMADEPFCETAELKSGLPGSIEIPTLGTWDGRLVYCVYSSDISSIWVQWTRDAGRTWAKPVQVMGLPGGRYITDPNVLVDRDRVTVIATHVLDAPDHPGAIASSQFLAATSEERAQLIAQLRATQKELELARQRDAEVATLRERERLARELHDNLGHSLVTLTVQLEAIQRLYAIDPARASAARLVALEVALATGAEYRGRSTFELPPSRARALDYVNAPGSFFTVWSNDLTRYFNKALVRLIRPLD